MVDKFFTPQTSVLHMDTYADNVMPKTDPQIFSRHKSTTYHWY